MDLKEFFSAPRDVANYLRLAVDSASLPNAGPAATLKPEASLEASIGSMRWALDASLEASISVFNAPSDQDPSRICGAVSAASDSSDAVPLLQPDDQDHVYLRYALAGRAKASGSADTGPAAVRVSGAGHVGAGAYRRSGGGTLLGAAISEHVSRMPLPFRPESVRSLRPGEACFVESGGSLALSLTLDWADLFAGPLAELRVGALLPETLVLDLGVAAQIAVDVALEDAFRIVFIGQGDERVRCVVTRNASQAFGIGAKLIGTIAFRDPVQAEGLLTQVAAQLLGGSRAQLETVRDALQRVLTRYEQATASWRELLGTATQTIETAIAPLGRLSSGLGLARHLHALAIEADGDSTALGERLQIGADRARTLLQQLEALAEEVQKQADAALDHLLQKLDLPALAEHPLAAIDGLLERLQRIEQAIVSVASRKIELGLTFEYRRVATQGTVFGALLDARDGAAFAGWHAAVLGLDLRPLLAAVGRGVELQHFLHRRSTRRTQAFGFSLGGFGERIVGERAWVDVTRYLPGSGDGGWQKLVSFKGSRAVERSGGERSRHHLLELVAEFTGQSGHGELGHWAFACALGRRHDTQAANSAWLAEVLDQATLWGSVTVEQAAALHAELVAALGDGAAASAHTQLLIGRTALADPDFIAALAENEDALVVRALAEALPLGQYWQRHPRRRTLQSRRETYAPIVTKLLKESGGVVQFDALARWTGDQLRGFGDPQLVRDEAATIGKRRPLHPGSVADVARAVNVHAARRQWTELATVARALGGLQTADDATRVQVRKMLDGLDANLIADYALRWQGRMLLLIADCLPRLRPAITCTTTLRLGAEATARTWVLGRI